MATDVARQAAASSHHSRGNTRPAGTLAVSTSTTVRAELPARCALTTSSLDECLGLKPSAKAGAQGAETQVNAATEGFARQ
jgi:hypothetical protein